MSCGDCVVFALKAGGEMGAPSTFGHNRDHGAYILKENNEVLVIDSSAKEAFSLMEGGVFEVEGTSWFLKKGEVWEKKEGRVSICL
jgi:hypothetical protein